MRIKTTTTQLFQRFWKSREVILMGGLLALGASLLVVLLGALTSTPVSRLTRDPLAVAGLPVYIGILSNLGVMIWLSTGAISIFAGVLLETKQEQRGFLCTGGAISLFLGLDDLFQFHEVVIPELTGAPEYLTYGLYILFVSIYLYQYRSLLSQTSYEILLAALAAFAFSIFIDDLFAGWITFVEDSFKFAAVILWLLYYVRTAYDFIKGQGAQSRPTGG